MPVKVNTRTIVRDLSRVVREHPSTIDGLTVAVGAKRLEEQMLKIHGLREFLSSYERKA